MQILEKTEKCDFEEQVDTMSVGRGVNLKDESEVTSNSDKIGFHILDNLEN